jgi:hypothetical protein
MRNLVITTLFLLSFEAQAVLLVNGGAEDGDYWDLVAWTRTPTYAPVYSTNEQPQGSGIVRPFEGHSFFTFAADWYPPLDYPTDLPYPGPIVLTQTGSRGLSATALSLTGWFQTEWGDTAEVALSILDNQGGVIESVTTGWISTFNPTWEAFPELQVAVPAGATMWMLELRGDLVFGDFVNVHFDDIRLAQVPEPGTLGILGSGLLALGAMRRKRAA